MGYEYLAIPAPAQAAKSKNHQTPAERLASAFTASINAYAQDGWEYLRTETLSVEDKRHALAKVEERLETVLIFRREVGEQKPDVIPQHLMTQETSEFQPSVYYSADFEDEVGQDHNGARAEATDDEASWAETAAADMEVGETSSALIEDDNALQAPILGGVSRD